MPSDQAGVTEEPDADETREDGSGQEKGLFRFIRRKPAKEKRSETEWVDTLRAAPEPEQEPAQESPFMEEEAPEEPEPEPEPVPESREEYRLERKWRRRHQDEMDEIHSYIDRVIGTDRDPLVRHRRMADLGVRRHPSTRREIASVDVEGIDEELMIAFTFPKEELRSARMVYETEGGYVIEVTRAVGGDDDHLERQHYTVSRVGSVAHALDNLRKEGETRTPAPVREPATNHGRSRLEKPESPPGPSSGSAPEPEPPEAAEPDRIDEERETAGPADEEEESDPKGGLRGFASRFKRSSGDTQPEPQIEPEHESQPEPEPEPPEQEPPQTERGPQAGDLGATGEPEGPDAADEEPTEKKGAFGGLASRLKRRGKGEEAEASPGISGDREDPSEPASDEPEDPEGEAPSKRGLLGGLPGFKRRRGSDDTQQEDEGAAEESDDESSRAA